MEVDRAECNSLVIKLIAILVGLNHKKIFVCIFNVQRRCVFEYSRSVIRSDSKDLFNYLIEDALFCVFQLCKSHFT